VSGLQVLVYLLPGIRAILMSANAAQAMMQRARGLRDPPMNDTQILGRERNGWQITLLRL
jgi:hypothetical protein